jgi:hypothetical protein
MEKQMIIKYPLFASLPRGTARKSGPPLRAGPEPEKSKIETARVV